MERTECDHDYQAVASERVEERWQDMSVPDDDLSGPELIDRFNGDITFLVTYRCRLCGHEYQEEEI